MLLHIDGSKHRWFQDERWYDLLVILDDASSEIYYAQLVAEESTRTVMAGLREVIERKGIFCALYSDRGSHFFWTPKTGEKVDKQRLTQIGRAMKELRIQMIPAYSPQARGRCERNFGTWQGRLPQELRLAGISDIAEANQFLRDRYIAEFNSKFAVPAKERGTAFRKTSRSDLDWIFSIQTERVVASDNTIAFRDQIWQLEKTRWRYSLAGCTVTVHEHLDGPMLVRYGPHLVASFDPRGNAISNRQATATVIPDSACGSKEVNSPFPFPLRGKPGRAGSPHAASTLRASKKTLARIDASGSPHKRAAAPL
jgi:transposase InsO family protein